ncbi:helix-turn-helix domain-containing protein [Paenibacillus sp. BAC0078]
MEYFEQIEHALEFIEQNLKNEITAPDVAGAAAYSYFHFHRVFETAVGETVGGYIRSRRLSKAAEELLYTDKRIIEIALSFRFESHEAFSRAFKKLYKVTPMQYRINKIDTIIGRKAALGSDALLHRQGVSLQPEIVMVPDMHLVGTRFPVSIEENSSIEMWPVFNNRIHEIRNRVQNSARYCIYEAHEKCDYDSFDAQAATTAFIGVAATPHASIPDGMVLKKFRGGKYAHFIHTGTTASLLYTYQYIWGSWIPYNKIELAVRDDIECFTERFKGAVDETSETDIYIPIK